MKLNRTPNPLDRNARNGENDNWDIIEGETRKINDKVDNFLNTLSEDAFNKVVDDIRLNWSHKVDNFADLPTNPKKGDTVAVENDDMIYRYDGSNWIAIMPLTQFSAIAEVDSRLTTRLAQTEQKREFIDFVRYGKQDINKWFPDFPVQLDFELHRGRNGKITHNFNFKKFTKDIPKVFVQAYGTGLGDGLSKENPVLTIKKALEVADTLSGDRVNIVLLDKLAPMYLFTTNVSPSGTVHVHNLTKNISITSDHKDGTYIYNGNRTDLYTWAKHSGNVYKTNRTLAKNVIDWKNRDANGLPCLPDKSKNLQDCIGTPNSWYTDGSVVYVHLLDGTKPQTDEIAISLELDQSFYFNAPGKEVFYDNVSFWTTMKERRSALQVLGNKETLVVMNNCSAALAKANGIAMINVGRVYSFNCTAFKNEDDGFNYHGVIGDGITEFAFEFNCYSLSSGIPGKTSSNASTAHDEMAVLRVGTIGHDCYGPLVADVNSTYSINIDCVMYDSLVPGSGAFYVNDSASEEKAKLVLINCEGGGKDTLTVAAVGEHEILVKNLIGNNIPEGLNISLMD